MKKIIFVLILALVVVDVLLTIMFYPGSSLLFKSLSELIWHFGLSLINIISIPLYLLIIYLVYQRASIRTIIFTINPSSKWFTLYWFLIAIAINTISLFILYKIGESKSGFQLRAKEYPLLTIIFIIINHGSVAIKEELLFRGFLVRQILTITKRKWMPILLSSLLFTIVHFPKISDIGIVEIFFWGLILGYITVETRSITIPVILHFVSNTCKDLSNSLYPIKLSDDIQLIIMVLTIVSFFIIFRIYETTQKNSN